MKVHPIGPIPDPPANGKSHATIMKPEKNHGYKPSPYSPTPMFLHDELELNVRSLAAYLVGLSIAMFVLTCTVCLLVWWFV